MLASQLGNLHAGLSLLQDRNDPFLANLLAFHLMTSLRVTMMEKPSLQMDRITEERSV